MPEMCEGRSVKSPGPCRPDLWSDDTKGFLEEIVLQCVFCKKQVRYNQLSQANFLNFGPVVVTEDVNSSSSPGTRRDGSFLH